MHVALSTPALAELDEALAHVAATLRRVRLLAGPQRAVTAVQGYADGLLDARLLLTAGKNSAAPATWPDTCQGLSPRQAGGVSEAPAAGAVVEVGAGPVNPGGHPSDAPSGVVA